jgi:geranylgeranyl pyrophosphate synthase
LDIGDFLVGEGYRLIAASGYPAETSVAMIEVAAECHRALCAGQGEELLALERGRLPLSVSATLDIFRGKTSPAFHAAIALGALASGADRATLGKLKSFSDSLGIAYQIRDDLGDWASGRPGRGGNTASPELSILASIVGEFGDSKERGAVARWCAGDAEAFRPALEAMRSSWAMERAEGLLGHYRNEASRSLSQLESPALESLLRKFVAGLFKKS